VKTLSSVYFLELEFGENGHYCLIVIWDNVNNY